MQIERHDNGNIEVSISFVVMSYLALFGAFCCLLGIGYFWLFEGLNIFSIQIIGLVLAGVILGIAGVIIYESSIFMFDNEKSELRWQKRKYFRAKRVLFHFMISRKSRSIEQTKTQKKCSFKS